MKLAVIGATGKAGSLIAEELKNRGHAVTAVVRPGSEGKLKGDYPVLNKNLFDLETEDLAGFDAVVDAFGSASYGPGNENVHVTAMRHMIDIMEPIPDVRLLVVGGAASLYKDDISGKRIVDDIPEGPAGAVPRNQMAAFEELKKSKVNWTFFSPAAKFDYAGKKTGRYILGTDYLIRNADGESRITYADYAIAMADEAEQGRFIRKRFTAVSDTSFTIMEHENNLFDIGSNWPFTRKGAYFGVFADPGGFRRVDPIFGGGRLMLGSRRATAGDSKMMFKFYPVYGGQKVSYAIHVSATQLDMITAYGKISICWPDDKMVYFKGENGLSLKFEKNARQHEILKPRKGNAWEAVLQDIGTLLFNPLKGGMDVDALWETEYISTLRMRATATPDENGEFLLAVEESLFAATLRDSYPTWEEAKEDVTKDWEEFLACIPHFNEELEEMREEAAYILWSAFVHPCGRVKRQVMFMTGNAIASSWQMCHNAVALHRNTKVATDLLLSYFYEQSPFGQIPDFVDECMILGQGIKPPVQGWALKWIMKDHSLKEEWSAEDLEFLYESVGRWGDWFLNIRDDDADGLPQYEHGDESGFDDSSVFVKTNMVESPDLAAYLGLLFEAEGDLAKILGRDDEAEEWYAKSKKIIDLLVSELWNGEIFTARVNGTHEPIVSESLIHYLPIVLGKRLPQEIIDKMTADLLVENEFLTPFGLASEKLTSTQFRISGMARGFVLPPYHLLILTGMYDAGKVEEAKMIAERYCMAMKKFGFNMLVNPIKGGKGYFGCSWPVCTYLVLADMISNM